MSPILLRDVPARIRATLEAFCEYRLRRTKILFVHNVTFRNYEGLDPRRPVIRWISYQHHTVLYIITGRRIPCHWSKIVPVEKIGLLVGGRASVAVGIQNTSYDEALGESGDRVLARFFCVASRFCIAFLLCQGEFLAYCDRS